MKFSGMVGSGSIPSSYKLMHSATQTNSASYPPGDGKWVPSKEQ